ncbi:MAG: radical SAM protein [Desulfobacteraceae bacterium]
MKIYLVLPACEQFRVKSPNGSVLKRKMLRFSVLSLTTLAALTPEKHEVVICDENVQAIDYDIDADLVGITFMTGLANRAYEISEYFQKRGIVTVAGGFHPTLNPSESQRYFNIVVSGEAEDTWPTVLEDVEKGCFKKLYESSFQSLDHVPMPRRDLLELTKKHYITTDAVQTGRGCMHKCTFCSVTAFFKNNHRSKPLDKVLIEVKSAETNFMFVDDNIIADREFAMALFKKMIPLKKHWVSQCSIKIADDDELLEYASKAGCIGLFIGIESVNRENLSMVDKVFNKPEEYKQKIRKINKAGIGVQAGMIVGLDSDDRGVFQRNLEFLEQAGIGALQLAILTPQPGTPLRMQFEKEGRIIDNNWDHYDYRHTVIEPKLMSPKDLQDGADWLYVQYYRFDRIIVRTITALLRTGFYPAVLTWRLNMTYRYDNKCLNLKGRNPVNVKRGFRLRILEQLNQSFGFLVK